MKRLRLFLILAAVAAVAVMSASQGFAQGPYVVQTGCDTLSLNPPLMHVTFGVINLSPIPVCSVHLTPINVGSSSADSCRILECSSPPGWQCSVDSTGGGHWVIDPAQPPGCINPYGKHEPFDIVLDPLYCCYRAQFDDPNGQIFYENVVCFECEKPVRTFNTTWGSVKAIYR